LALLCGRGARILVRGSDHPLRRPQYGPHSGGNRGMALAALCAGLGAIAKSVENRLEGEEVDPNGPKSLGEALRK
jgi:hypothetical protein